MINIRLLLTILVGTLVTALHVHADVVVQTPDSTNTTDQASWSRAGGEGSSGAAFTASSVKGLSVIAHMPDGQGTITNVCPASPCGWTGTGFSGAETLLWTTTNMAGRVVIIFPVGVTSAGISIQPDVPGAFTAELEAFQGATSLGTYPVSSITGNAIYLGVKDLSGPNINSIAVRITQCATACTDFSVGTVHFDVGSPVIKLATTSLTFKSQEINQVSSSQAITVSNVGQIALTVKLQAASPFIVTSNCGTQLLPQSMCSIQVSFKPLTPSTFQSILTIGDGAPAVTLHGEGVQTKFYGTLTTQDPADQISFALEPSLAVPSNSIQIQFCIANNITWRKTAFVEYGNNSQTRLSVADSAKCDTAVFATSTLHTMELWKAGFLGIMKWVDSLPFQARTFMPGGGSSTLPGGTRLTLTWTRSCLGNCSNGM